jgi:hypothetical protein
VPCDANVEYCCGASSLFWLVCSMQGSVLGKCDRHMQRQRLSCVYWSNGVLFLYELGAGPPCHTANAQCHTSPMACSPEHIRVKFGGGHSTPAGPSFTVNRPYAEMKQTWRVIRIRHKKRKNALVTFTITTRHKMSLTMLSWGHVFLRFVLITCKSMLLV